MTNENVNVNVENNEVKEATEVEKKPGIFKRIGATLKDKDSRKALLKRAGKDVLLLLAGAAAAGYALGKGKGSEDEDQEAYTEAETTEEF